MLFILIVDQWSWKHDSDVFYLKLNLHAEGCAIQCIYNGQRYNLHISLIIVFSVNPELPSKRTQITDQAKQVSQIKTKDQKIPEDTKLFTADRMRTNVLPRYVTLWFGIDKLTTWHWLWYLPLILIPKLISPELFIITHVEQLFSLLANMWCCMIPA